MFCSDPFSRKYENILFPFLRHSALPHLGHDDTDVVDALYNGLAAPRDCDGSLRTVW